MAAALVGVVLMQRSEGGGLASAGIRPAGSEHSGAADFLTRSTKWLASGFRGPVVFVLAALAVRESSCRHCYPRRLTAATSRPRRKHPIFWPTRQTLRPSLRLPRDPLAVIKKAAARRSSGGSPMSACRPHACGWLCVDAAIRLPRIPLAA